MARRLSDYDSFPVGRHTYGNPEIIEWGEGATLSIGAFCSIAEGVAIFLGGNHRLDWVTTYPFNYLWECGAGFQGHPATKGDVVIGNDVWIGRNAAILSGVHIGDGAVGHRHGGGGDEGHPALCRGSGQPGAAGQTALRCREHWSIVENPLVGVARRTHLPSAAVTPQQ